MANRPFEERSLRSLTRTAAGSYFVTIPIEHIKTLKWRDKQKVVVELIDDSIVIKDWKKKK